VTVPFGLSLLLMGLGLRLWSLRTLLQEGVSEESIWMPEKQKTYTDRGPYRFLSHPAYVGSMLAISGAGVAALGWCGAVLALPAWPFFALRIHQENKLRWP